MRIFFSYLLYIVGFILAFVNLYEVFVETDEGKTIFRSLEYSSIVILMSVFIYLVFRDAAFIVGNKKLAEKDF